MEPEGSLPHPQVLATCPYYEPARPSPSPHHTSWRFILILFSHLHLGLPSGLFLSGFPTKTLYTRLLSPISATCYILLDLITWIILGEQYRSLSSSLCSFLHSLVTSSLLGPNNNNNNNNNNIYLLQLGCHPVAVVILHVNKTWNLLLLNLSREGYMRSM